MAVKTMQVSSQTGKFDAGWHELTINKAEDGMWTSQAGVEKKYIELYFEGYPESMNLRMYEVFNKETHEEFKIANLFRYANAGILGVLKDPTGKKPVIQYDDEPINLVGKTINVFFYKEQKTGKEYMRIFDNIAPVEQEGEYVSWTGDQVAKMKANVEKSHEKMMANATVNTMDTITTTDTASDVPF